MWYPAKVVSVTNPQMNSEQAKNEEIAALLEGEELLTLQEVADKLDLQITRGFDLLGAREFIAWRDALVASGAMATWRAKLSAARRRLLSRQ